MPSRRIFRAIKQDKECTYLECPFCHHEFWADPVGLGENVVPRGNSELEPICPECGWLESAGMD